MAHESLQFSIKIPKEDANYPAEIVDDDKVEQGTDEPVEKYHNRHDYRIASSKRYDFVDDIQNILIDTFD